MKDVLIELKTEVQAVMVELQCPKCLTGTMTSSGNALMTYPPQYHHFCNVPDCGHTVTVSGKTYPAIEYRKL